VSEPSDKYGPALASIQFTSIPPVQNNSPLYSCSCSLSYKSLSFSSFLMPKQLSVKVKEIDDIVDTDVEIQPPSSQ